MSDSVEIDGVTYHVMKPAEEYEYQRAVREARAFNRPLPDRSQFIRSEDASAA